MTTFIIGTKINPIFPKTNPTNIIGINGAVHIIEKKYNNFKNVTMVCSPHIFLNDFEKLKKIYEGQDIDIKSLDTIRKKIMDKKPKGIIIRPLSDPTFFEYIKKLLINDNILQKNCFNYHRFKENEFEKFILQSFKTNYYKIILKELFYKKSTSFKNLARSIINRNTFVLKPFKISTGILGLMIAISDPNFSPPYYIIGVGKYTSAYAYTNKVNVRDNHIYADLSFMASILKNTSLVNKVFFTDKDLNIEFNNFIKNKRRVY